MTAVHQLIPNFVPGDASGQAALHLQLLLRRMGRWGEIYAGDIAKELTPLVRPVAELRPSADDLVLYHHGIASPLSGKWMHLPCRRGVVFHNITPARYHSGEVLAEALQTGRAQLAAMAGHADLSIGVSEYNAQELVEAGHRNVHVVPLFIEPERFRPENADPRLSERLRGEGPLLLSVGRVTAHKRVEDIVTLHRELRVLRPKARLAIVGGYAPGSRYFRSLAALAREAGNVEFLGRLSHAEVVAAYRSATLFVSMSEHEGFGVPFMEAMAADLPILAYAAAAVPETLGASGVAFTEKRFALLAELARELHDVPKLRAKLLEGQRKRLQELSAERAQEALTAALGPQLRGPARLRSTTRRRRIGVIVQRFSEASGGAERHAREIALRLSEDWDVTVLTSCAENHLTWENTLPPGTSRDGGLLVHRFPTRFARQTQALNAKSRRMFRESSDRLDEELWLSLQGPELPGLLSHLAEANARYDAFIAFTYLYAPTARAVPMVSDKCLVVPTAHDEPPLRFGVFADVFRSPRALLCNTEEEAELIRTRWPDAAPTLVAGVGVEPRKASPERFRKKYDLRRPYLLYVGRIEHDKGIPDLLHYHRKLVRDMPEAPELVLAGDSRLRLLGGKSIRYLGRISEEDKWNGLAGARAAVVPSAFESLSLLALEAFSVGTPMLANAASAVLRGHIRRGGAGFLFGNALEYKTAVQNLLPAQERLRAAARKYAERFTWDRVMTVYRDALA